MNLGQEDVGRLNWGGLKVHVARLMALRWINPVVQVAARNLLPVGMAQRLPLSIRHVAYRMEDGSEVRLLNPGKDIVARDIHWGGGRPTSRAEQHKFRCIERLSKLCCTFLDVGAYSGVCALVAARSNPTLISVAYEIVPQNYSLLVNNILENDLATRVEARLMGIGAAPGSVRLPTSIGLASNPTSMSIGSSFDEGVRVNVGPLDAQVDRMQGPFFIKIDVEGYESEVFQGATKLLAESKPDIILEVLPDAAAACALIEGAIASLGYQRFMLTDDGAVVRESLATDTVGRDWLLTTRDDVDSILGAPALPLVATASHG